MVACSKIVADLRAQSASVGETHHAIAGGLLEPAHVHAELGEILLGRIPGRTSDTEVIIFDSTGTALQDVAAAAAVYERARANGVGIEWSPA